MATDASADPVHSVSRATSYWSTSNFGEAMPGVVTPLCWSVWGPGGEAAFREGFYRMGAISRRERAISGDPLDRVINIFHGRVAGRVDFLFRIGDRLPGSSGPAVAEQIVGAVPAGMVSRRSFRRYPVIAARFPHTLLTISSVVEKRAPTTRTWWRASVDRVPSLDRAGALALFTEGRNRFAENVALQGTHVLCAVSTSYDLMEKLVDSAGFDDVNEFMAGFGSHAESAVVDDLWKAAHGRLDFAEVVRRHGYHGPGEGELSSTVWREDDAPLRRLLDSYVDTDDPAIIEAEKRAHREEMERMLLSRLSPLQRRRADIILKLVRRNVPVRGVAKAAFLQSLDVTRAAARRLGEHLVADGLLAERDDIFFLTADELEDRFPDDAKAVVDERKERHATYRTMDLPSAWRGTPTPVPLAPVEAADAVDAIGGLGASPGVVEGRVRVIVDPGADDIEPDEILVAPFTDPSWAPLMYVSKALVVDIGGALSHAAIVARELGIPCVVNARNATRTLRTGDLCRVDGASGDVTVLRRRAD